jgi:tetratricopeptide (TPR) repeat protein
MTPIIAIQLFCILSTAAPATAATPLEKALDRIYNYDFAGAYTILDAERRLRPEDPLLPAIHASALLFEEFDRLQILELEFFESDDTVTDKKKIKPDPEVRKRLFAITAEARDLAQVVLALDPDDSNALFAMCTAVGVETDYAGLIEKKYFRTYSLSKESQKYARRLLALNPPFYDAYVTMGTVEYVVGNLNFFFRLFIRFEQIEGSKQKAIEDLKKAAEHGRYFGPFAKTLLAAIYMRENQTELALELMKDLEQAYPENTLIKREIRRAREKLDNSRKNQSENGRQP